MATAQGSFVSVPTPADPYQYQTGFGNRFATEALPGVLPIGRNTPQKCKYDLYSEQLNGSPFISSRATLQHAWFYRIRPAVAHGAVKPFNSNSYLESNFSPLNPNVQYLPEQLAWDPFPLPSSSDAVDFVSGLRTIGGQGDSTTKEGVAVHVYAANTSMGKKAFASNDGDMLILPQQGRLDIQTEYGKMMVRPGELCVIQAGIRFRVQLPDDDSRGYIQEVFGSHYELPELGPIGSNGMAMPRDFEIPVASFDLDESNWEIVYKFAGKLYTCTQNHTPFDVVAWHGTYTPYKYCLEKFITIACVDRDQCDPTVYCVLVAKSKIPGVSTTEFLAFTPKWSVTSNTFRPPYYHRNMASEVMGLIYGKHGGSSHVLDAGGLSYEGSLMPHGESYETWKEATTRDLPLERVSENTIAFMFHISSPFSLTKYALEAENLHPSPSGMWDDVQPHFMEHIDEINADLASRGLSAMVVPAVGTVAKMEKGPELVPSEDDMVVVSKESEEQK